MQVEWDIPIAMDDGVVLRADVFRPPEAGKHPVILSYGPYAKGLSFQQGYKSQWARLIKSAPEVLQGSSNKYQNWELVDPERWVPDGYACVRVDSRGAGRSPGILDVWSPREAQDLYQCVEWAGTQPFSNGKVGINGISYYAMNQWQVGALNPPHLAALCIWEGASDYYRELDPPRRHSLRFSVELVSTAGGERAARRRRAWRPQRSHRRTGGRSPYIQQRGIGAEPRRYPRRSKAAAAPG
jgi:uncharacterized protein